MSQINLSRQTAEAWLERWERQQAVLVEAREARFDAMIALLAAHRYEQSRSEQYLVLDLGCGPGSLSRRILRRLPGVEVIAVDTDPVLLAIGRTALGDVAGLKFAEADLRWPHWLEAVRSRTSHFDAVVSTTALHWLSAAELARLYREIARLLRDGGLFLNGDYLVHRQSPQLRRISERAGNAALGAAQAADPEAENWENWWQALARDVPELAAAFAERAKRYPDSDSDGDHDTLAEFHLGALLECGFSEAQVLWRSHTTTIVGALLASKP